MFLEVKGKRFSGAKIIQKNKFKGRKSIAHWNWRTGLGQILSIRLSKTASVVVPR